MNATARHTEPQYLIVNTYNIIINLFLSRFTEYHDFTFIHGNIDFWVSKIY